MKQFLILLALVLLAGAVGVSAAETYKGDISDKMCGADHHGEDPVKCTLACVKNGSPFVFVMSKEKILDIENQKDPKIKELLMKYAGLKVSVTGTMNQDGKSIKIESITE